MDIKTLLDQPHKLPTVPAVTLKLIASFSDEDVDFRQIAAQISADPALSAKLLRLANSAYFHLSRSIGSVDEALQTLGLVMVRNLVLGNGMAVAFRSTKGMNLPQFWRYNLFAASAARWLAGQVDTNADQAFTVGLVHGVGQLQMHVAAPQAVLPLDKILSVLDAGRSALEQDTLGFTSSDVAAELAKLWNFPAPIVSSMRAVANPLGAPEFSDCAACVHLGAWVARQAVEVLTPEQAKNSYPQAVAQRLGLTWETVGQQMPAMGVLSEGLEDLLA